MSTEFVHLHLHSDYSLLDGACSVAGIIEMAQEYNMHSVAITDHGFMGGAIDFYQKTNKNRIKPILGFEAYVSPTNRFDKDSHTPNIKGFHLILLAKDNKGYQNLCKLNSAAFLEGFYYKPRIDKELLAAHSEGLIALSACLHGEIQYAIMENRIKDSKRILGEYLDIMGPDNFYLEVMDHNIKEQAIVNKELVLLGKEFEIPLVATNDVHYLRKEHSRAHELLLCIQTRSTMNDEKRFKFSSDQFYFKSGDEMAQVFREIPKAVSNTLEVAERCNVNFKFAPDVNHYPVYEISKPEMTEKEYLREICLDGIIERYEFDPRKPELDDEAKAVIDRMDFELNVIDNSHYCSYFLVVWDFLKYAREEKIPVGPGRGSGAGSIVAYLTHITDIDPLEYQLLFERFLNPDRVSPPDFDIDFCESRRPEVIEYVRRKYGSESVAQIGTYGTLKAKAVIKDVARVLGHLPAEGDKITKLIPGSPNTLDDALENNRELRDLISNESYVENIFKNAEPLVGLNRNMTIHAAGVIIGDQRLDNLVPLAQGSNKEIITQFSGIPCEDLGLLKMDFLGLRTLTIIQNAVDNIKKSRGEDLNISKVTFKDPKTFELLNKGDTVAVFQLESSGMQSLCRQFGVETINHIIALIAIYRPGPMQFIPDFIARKMGHTRIEYDHPLMEDLLKETYGIMLYQEQIMQVVQKLAGFSLGQADILRRAIGKKKVSVMEEQKEKFVKGCADTNQISSKLADSIWEKIAMFAGYGFNKSHSAAYAFLAYRTAYLKANYPVEFMCAVLSSELDNADKIKFFITECRQMGIQVLSPDVNASEIDFSVDGDSICFGMGAIKGVGSAATETILECRDKDGKFTSFTDFCERVGSAVNSRMMECLCRAGAFDNFGLKRSQLVALIEPTMSYAQGAIRDRESGQGSLFDLLDEEDKAETMAIPVPDIPEFDEHELLKSEKALLGFYVTGHPIAKYADQLEIFTTTSLAKVLDLPKDTGVKVGGIIKTAQKKINKKNGKPYAILEIEDLDGVVECMVFSSVFEKELEKKNPDDETKYVKDLLVEETPVFIEALVSQRDETDPKKLMADNIIPFSEVREKYSQELHLHIYEGSTKQGILDQIKNLCAAHKAKEGGTKVILCVTCVTGEIAFIEASERYSVRVTEDLLQGVQNLLGENRYKIKPDKSVPQPRRKFYKPKNNDSD